MGASLLLRGLMVGFSIAAPVGPIGVLCIRRTLAEGRAFGFVSGLGAATADAVYGGVAGFGLTFVSSFLVGQQAWFRLVGGAFLCYLGLRTFLSQPAKDVASTRTSGLLGAYASTLFLTLTNPMTILSFAAIFAGLGPVLSPVEGSALGDGGGSYLSAAVLVLGVFLGSALWWLLLSGGAGLFRHKLDLQKLRWVNRISGAVIAAFGLLALLSTCSKTIFHF
jgi:threonine/homoserine/homoserine lactone efflux protein